MAFTPNVKKYLPDVNKNYVWAGVLILGAAIGLYYWGKKNATVQQYPVPNDDPSNPLTDDEKKQITELTNSIHTSINSSWNFITGWDWTPLQKLTSVSDRIFAGVYNHYNRSFLTGSNTLYTELKSEWAWVPPTLPPFNNSEMARQIFTTLFARFDRLGMK
jgi:hypothetical protein